MRPSTPAFSLLRRRKLAAQARSSDGAWRRIWVKGVGRLLLRCRDAPAWRGRSEQGPAVEGLRGAGAANWSCEGKRAGLIGGSRDFVIRSCAYLSLIHISEP